MAHRRELAGKSKLVRALAESWERGSLSSVQVPDQLSLRLGRTGQAGPSRPASLLFDSLQERELYLRLVPTNGVTDEDLRYISLLSLRVLQSSQLEELEASPAMMQRPVWLHREGCSKTKDRVLLRLLRDVLHEYKVSGYVFRWKGCVPGANRLLLTARPPESISPHDHALITCMYHGYCWMINTRLPVYKALPDLSYSALRSGPEDQILVAAAENMYMMERIPNYVEVCKRMELLQAKL
ncbi:hypothetical protein SELMODRAFT_432446, partial [Selaginella moellendorffii]